MIFRCTGKAQRALRLRASDLVPPPSVPSNTEWHCNVITLARRPFFLFAHTLSLFGVLVAAAGHSRRTAFAEAFRHSAVALLGHEALGIGVRRVLDDGPDLFAKATDRRVLGSMVDFSNMSKWVVEDEGSVNPDVILRATELINKSPMSILDMESPREALHSLLATG
jgi:hypothetical protein